MDQGTDDLFLAPSSRAEFKRLRSQMIDAKRKVTFEFRDDGGLPEDIAGRSIYDLDLDEAAVLDQ